MTCIIGLAQDNKVYLGADSGVYAGHMAWIDALPKVFKVGPFMIGQAGDLRISQLLRVHLVQHQFPDQSEDDYSYIVLNFIEPLRELAKAHDYEGLVDEESAVQIILGYKGIVWEFGKDFYLYQHTKNFAAVGAAREIALGALSALTHMTNPRHRIQRALEISADWSVFVRPPFVIFSSEDEDAT